MTGLRQSDLREKVQAFFRRQLDQYIDWLDRHGLQKKTLEYVKEEMLDHQSFLDLNSTELKWLPVARFKRKMNVADADWEASMPRIAQELRKGRRDLLKAVLEAAERQDEYRYDPASLQPLPAAQTHPEELTAPVPLAGSAPLGKTIDEFILEHSREWTEKTRKQVSAYLEILVEYFGKDRLLGNITRKDASEVKKILQLLPSSRNTKPTLRAIPLMEVIKVSGHSKLSSKTINAHIDSFRRFFEWAERHGHAPHRLFEGLKVPKAKDTATQRLPFSSDQLNDIFLGSV
ncbi:MAG: hypothetical protein ACK4VZ_14885 [Paracoccaceae bacterium]